MSWDLFKLNNCLSVNWWRWGKKTNERTNEEWFNGGFAWLIPPAAGALLHLTCEHNHACFYHVCSRLLHAAHGGPYLPLKSIKIPSQGSCDDYPILVSLAFFLFFNCIVINFVINSIISDWFIWIRSHLEVWLLWYSQVLCECCEYETDGNNYFVQVCWNLLKFGWNLDEICWNLSKFWWNLHEICWNLLKFWMKFVEIYRNSFKFIGINLK